MQFLKKHYEKILFGIVLLGLAAVSVSLLFLVAGEKDRLNELQNTFVNHPVQPLPPPEREMAKAEELLHQAASAVALDFTTSNKLFNPLRWQRAANGQIFPNPAGTEISKLEITKITPLYLVIALDNVIIAPDSPPRYAIGVIQEAAANPHQRAKKVFASIGEKKDLFTIQSAEGPVDNPTNVVVQLADTGETVSFSKAGPFQRIEGYTADLKYAPENRIFPPGRRVGDTISFAGENYTIANITTNEVILQAKSNQKKWPVYYNNNAP